MNAAWRRVLKSRSSKRKNGALEKRAYQKRKEAERKTPGRRGLKPRIFGVSSALEKRAYQRRFGTKTSGRRGWKPRIFGVLSALEKRAYQRRKDNAPTEEEKIRTHSQKNIR